MAIPQYAHVRIGRDGLPVGHFCKVPPEHDKQNWCRIDITQVTEEELLEGANHMRHHYPYGDSFCVHCAKRGETDVEFEERIAAQTIDWYGTYE